ncbi:MAG: molybdopterin-binding protein, partial [Pseudomonadota bacterium]
ANAVTAPDAVPECALSQTEGYAIQSRDLIGPAPWSFKLGGQAGAGEHLQTDIVHRKSAVRVAVGTCLKYPFDQVVPLERAQQKGPLVEVDDVSDLPNFVQPRGDLFAADEIVVAPGKMLNSRDVALLAAAGHCEAPILRKLRVAILSVGEGLVGSDDPDASGRSRDVNRPMLEARLGGKWIEVRDFGIVPEGPDALRLTLDMAAAWADVILTTGGTSGGSESRIAHALSVLNATTHVSGIAMQPGGSTRIGQIGAALFVAMPGSPVAVEIVMTTLVQAMLARRVGLPDGGPAFARGALGSALEHGSDRTRFQLTRIGQDAQEREVLELLDADATDVRALAIASGIARIAPSANGVSAGQEVLWFPFHDCQD